ncbi:MAG TPA: hypothetical protein DFR83_09935, partial [Deltaproteobacteria bacterium]|nr:hypothetical protein [Deltaproteobacteria bacterium]
GEGEGEGEGEGAASCLSSSTVSATIGGTSYTFDSFAWEDVSYGAIILGYETSSGGGACDYGLGNSTYGGTYSMRIVIEDPAAAQGDTLDIGVPAGPTPPPATISAISIIESGFTIAASSASGSASLDSYASGSDIEVGSVSITYDDGSTASGGFEACFCSGLGTP